MTRADAIERAFKVWLESRRAELDAAQGLRCLVLDLKFSPDALEPREVIDRIERERRLGPREERQRA